MIRILLAVIVLTAASPAFAQSGPAGPDAVADRFFKLLQNGQVNEAYADVGRGTLVEQKKLELQNVANQTTSMLQLYGKIVDWEIISEKKWSSSYSIRNYLVRAEKGPVFFNFHLYRSVNGWIIGTIYFTDIPKNLPDS